MTYPYKPREKWDIHTHTTCSPDTYGALGRFTHYADFIRIRAHATMPCCAEMVNGKGEVQRVVEENAYNGEVRIADCDRHGVAVQVLSPTPMMIPDYVDNSDDAAEICRILNDDNAATAARFPKRFLAIGALPMRHPDAAVKEMDRIRREHGMRGIEINSNINGMELDEERIFPVFAAAAEMGMAVFVHPWGGFMTPAEERLKKRMNAGRNWRPWLIGMGMETALAFDSMRSGGVHERLPKLRVMYAHGGGAFPALLGRMEHGAYCRPDLFSGASQLDPYRTIKECGVYTDSLTHSPWVLNMLVESLGPERIAMGSDYPYPLGEIDTAGNKKIYPGYMIEHLPGPDTAMDAAQKNFLWTGGGMSLPRLTDRQRERMLSGTAKEWLGYS